MTEIPGQIEQRGAFPSVVAVTGGTGLMGRSFVPALAQSAREVRVLARSGRGVNATISISGDLGNKQSLARLVAGADAVVHLAGMAHTTLRDQAEVDRAFAVNVEGTKSLLEAARAGGVRRFVLLSSAHVYAGQRGENLTETSPTSPDNPYSQMKLLAEQAAKEAAGPDFSVTILRPCLTYGPGVRHNLKSLIRAIKGSYYVQPAGAQTVRSFVSVDTVNAAIVHLLPDEMPGCQAYNPADRNPVVLEQWVDHLADLMGARHPRTLLPSLLAALASVGSLAVSLRLPAPLTRTSLAKLTQPFWLNVDKLAATGFEWPSTTEEVLRQMIHSELESTA